jgi:LCP family protein required for cell wall assembly
VSAVRRVAAAAVTVVLLMLVPAGTTAPTVMSLVAVDSAEGVGWDEGVVWVLALGSDSRTGEPLEGNADAIELIALDTRNGRAVAIGIARDSWIQPEGMEPMKLTETLGKGGPQLVATEVAKLTDITPQYVLTTGFEGFEGMVDTIGVLQVRSATAFEDPEHDLVVQKGVNDMDGSTATSFARSRYPLRNDFQRQANQQQLLASILRQLREHQDEEGFMEAGALSALTHLETDLSPPDLYRFAQAVTQIDPLHTDTCVITGTDDTIGVQQVVHLDTGQAQRVAADAADDATLQGGCR